MKLSKNSENLLAYIHDELDDQSKQEMQEELQNCEVCQAEERSIREHLDMYSKLPKFECSEKSWQSLANLIEQEKEPEEKKGSIVSMWHWSLAAAATIAMAFSLSFYYISAYPSWQLDFEQGNFSVVDSKSSAPSNILPTSGTMYLEEGTLISTSRGKTAKYRVLKEDQFILGCSTQLELKEYPRVLLKQGEVFVRSDEASRAVVIETLAGKVQSHSGAIFSVHCRGAKASVKVYRGQLEFNSPQGSSQIKEGEMIIAQTGHNPQLVGNSEEGFPWWEESNIALNLEVEDMSLEPFQLLLNLNVKNKNKEKLSLPLNKENLLKLLVVANGKSFCVRINELTNEKNNHINLEANEAKNLTLDVSKILPTAKQYEIIAVYKDLVHNKEVASLPLRVQRFID